VRAVSYASQVRKGELRKRNPSWSLETGHGCSSGRTSVPGGFLRCAVAAVPVRAAVVHLWEFSRVPGRFAGATNLPELHEDAPEQGANQRIILPGELKLARIWLFVEGNPVNDGFVFWIRAVPYDLAVKILSDTPAGGVLYGYGIDETSFAESCVSPLNKSGHDFSAKTLPVRAFLEPKAEFGRNRIRVFQRGHAKALPVFEPPDDERKLVRFWSRRSLLASSHVLAPRWRLPWHESGDGGRDASSLSTTNNT